MCYQLKMSCNFPKHQPHSQKRTFVMRSELRQFRIGLLFIHLRFIICISLFIFVFIKKTIPRPVFGCLRQFFFRLFVCYSPCFIFYTVDLNCITKYSYPFVINLQNDLPFIDKYFPRHYQPVSSGHMG